MSRPNNQASRQAAWIPIVCLCLAGCLPQESGPEASSARIRSTSERVPFQIGETTIHARLHQVGANTLTMVNVHDDENTSVEAGKVVLERHGGRLIELEHTGRRRVVFTLDGQSFSFDPNRIFTTPGRRQTVRGQGPIPEKARAAVRDFAERFIGFFNLDEEPVLIALHNNGDGGFSIRSYEPGGAHAVNTAELHVNPERDPDDFYYVTEKRFFDAFKQRGFNVILQDNEQASDDGSLSVYAARQRIPYINVEAEEGHLLEQIEMIEAVYEILGAQSPGAE